jgi:hypothetical protein
MDLLPWKHRHCRPPITSLEPSLLLPFSRVCSSGANSPSLPALIVITVGKVRSVQRFVGTLHFCQDRWVRPCSRVQERFLPLKFDLEYSPFRCNRYWGSAVGCRYLLEPLDYIWELGLFEWAFQIDELQRAQWLVLVRSVFNAQGDGN